MVICGLISAPITPIYHSQKLGAAIQYWEKKGLHFARIEKSDSEGVKIGWAAPWTCTVHTHSSNKLAQKLVHMQSIWDSQLAPGHNGYAAIQKENLLATKWNQMKQLVQHQVPHAYRVADPRLWCYSVLSILGSDWGMMQKTVHY
jgi:hypothetical protein